MTLLADLSSEFGWRPSDWRPMPWTEFTAWVEELGRRRDEERRARMQAEQEAEMARRRNEFFRRHR